MAPDPSPSRIPRSSRAGRPSALVDAVIPGSAPAWLVMTKSRTSGQIAVAVRAAEQAITPSMSTGTRREAAARMYPAMAACSKPPTFANASTGWSASGRLTWSARDTTPILCW